MRRLAMLIGGIVGPTLSLASFELMLIPGDNRVYRYDPANDVRLGSFVANQPDAIAVDSASGTAYVANSIGNQFRAYNYSTGLATGGPLGQNMSYNLILNGPIMVSPDGSTIRTRNLVSGFSPNFASPAGMTSAQAISVISGNRYAVIGKDSANNIVGAILDSSFVLLGSVSTIVSSSSVAAGAFVGGSVTITTNAERVWFSYRNASNNHVVVSSQVSGSNLIAGVTASTSSLFFSSAANPTIVASHDGYYLVGEAATDTQTAIVRYITNFSNATAVASTILTDVDCPTNLSVGMVVAPEPGTMAVLALGLLPVLRKRRSQ